MAMAVSAALKRDIIPAHHQDLQILKLNEVEKTQDMQLVNVDIKTQIFFSSHRIVFLING